MVNNNNILQDETIKYAFRKLKKDPNDGFEYLAAPSYIGKNGKIYDYNWTFNTDTEAMEFLEESINMEEITQTEANDWYLVKVCTGVLFQVKDKHKD